MPLEVADGDEPFEPLPCAVDDGVVQRFYEFDVAWQPELWVKSLLDQVSVDARAKPRIVINVIEDHAVPHGQPDTTVVVDVVCCANADGLTDYNTENYWEGFRWHGKWHGKWWQHEDQPKRSCKWCGYDTYQRKGVCTVHELQPQRGQMVVVDLCPTVAATAQDHHGEYDAGCATSDDEWW